MNAERSKPMLHIYTGDGKGKTTAAVGLAVRAAGAGMKVFFAQLMKNTPTAEAEVFKLLEDRVTFRQFGTGEFVTGKPSDEDIVSAQNGFKEVEKAVRMGMYAVVVVDELCTALHWGLLDPRKVFRLVENCPEKTELVFTGRNATPDLVEKADLVTEMREVKHYYEKGVEARRGIEF
ncbi:MAG: cob(I)yrinic acid a,c-diamide adenosyltransferase [Chitinispirillaceae bacterium]